MKICLLIADGVGIRNFLCSSFIERCTASHDVLIWHGLSNEIVAAHQSRFGNAVTWRRLPSFKEGINERILRFARNYSQLFWFYHVNNSHVVLSRTNVTGRWQHRLLHGVARILGRICGSRQGTTWLDRHYWRTVRHRYYIKEFQSCLSEQRPDILFCTHQRASAAVPAMIAAGKERMPTATFIYSWDNLPKGRMAVHADHFLVWSDFMKGELLEYYPDVPMNRVHVVGTPQFEHYFNDKLIENRETFCRKIRLDSSRSIICFSGDDITTSPNDPHYLCDLAEQLRTVPIAQRPQILFRQCPVDRSERYRWVLEKYPEIVESRPIWTEAHDGDWTQVVPLMDDITLLTNVVYHCDLVINVASTMAMDFAIVDKPAIYVNYNVNQSNSRWNIHDTYRLPHFRSVHELQPLYWANSKQELAKLVMDILNNRNGKSRERRDWLEKSVEFPLNAASARCYNVLLEIVTDAA